MVENIYINKKPYRIAQVANVIAKELLKHNRQNPIYSKELGKKVGLTTGQISSVIAYMRECALSNHEKFIRFYPISGGKGYFFAESIEDLFGCYRKLYWDSQTTAKRIEPLRREIIQNGFDIENIIFNRDSDDEEDFENYIDKFGEYEDYRDEIRDMSKDSWDKAENKED